MKYTRLIAFLLFTIASLSAMAQVQSQDNIKLNQIQVIGSHNSYKQPIDPKLFSVLQAQDSAFMASIDYSHIPLSDQLNLGLLDLEIDVYADTVGGKYAHPKGLDMAPGQAPYDPKGVMKKPGFKVFHIQEIDFRSSCLTFALCLQELKQWSVAHPNHNPVFITMNAKNEIAEDPDNDTSIKYTSAIFDKLDKEIAENLGVENLITPDMVRGKYATLEEAVLHQNWPTLKQARGKFLFILDEQRPKIDAYIAGHPSLKDRLIFTNSEPGTPEAAIIQLNRAVYDKDNITSRVKQGYIVRTRADSDTHEARANDKSQFNAAMESGAQVITTDYYRKSDRFKSDYIISFPGGKFFRLNPQLVK